MPGKPVTDQQARLRMHDRPRHPQRAAAARAGFEPSAPRAALRPIPVSPRSGAPSAAAPSPIRSAWVWEPVVLPILERDPSVLAVTLFRHLQMTDPEAFPDDRVWRTLERRVRDWRAARTVRQRT